MDVTDALSRAPWATSRELIALGLPIGEVYRRLAASAPLGSGLRSWALRVLDTLAEHPEWQLDQGTPTRAQFDRDYGRVTLGLEANAARPSTT